MFKKVVTPKKILIIEDNEFLCRDIKEIVLKDYLEVINLPLLTETYKSDLLELLDEGRIDLVILDINLGRCGLNGVELLHIIRKKHPKEKLPVLILTLYLELAQGYEISHLANGILRKQSILERKGIEELRLVIAKILDNPLEFCPQGTAEIATVNLSKHLLNDPIIPIRFPSGRYLSSGE